MNIRSSERHPARSVTNERNWLAKIVLDSTADYIPENELKPGFDGVTHEHMIEGSNFVLYILTHYVEEIDTYFLLQITKSTFNPPKDDPTYGVTTLLPRGKTSEEIAAREELSDEHIAEVIDLLRNT